MPAKRFICPTGDEINMYECLLRCPQGTRCMFLPTLCAVASSLERNLDILEVNTHNFDKLHLKTCIDTVYSKLKPTSHSQNLD